MHTRIARHLFVAAVAALLVIPVIPAGVAANGPEPSLTTLALAGGSTSSSVYGTPVSFTASVVDAGSLGGTPTGTVTLWDGPPETGGTAVDTESLVDGIATLSTSSLTVTGSPHSMVAVYNGDLDFAVSPEFNVLSESITMGSQAISFAALPDETLPQSPVIVSASASSGLPVTFSTSSTACSVTPGGTVTLLTVGQCSITASQLGNSNWNAATPVPQTFNITMGSQTISFAALPDETLPQSPVIVSASASSGLPVTFSTSSTACSVTPGGTVTLLTVGQCSITASQLGNSNWNAATPVPQTFNITMGSQTISFAALPDETLPQSPVIVSASASSGLPVTFSTSSTACSVTPGGTVTLLTVGQCSITASQLGNSNWNAATPVPQTFNITMGSQTISFAAPTTATVGGATYSPTATASSGLPVAFSIDGSTGAGICSLSGGVVSFTGIGNCAIDANQPGDSSYSAAPQVQQTITVSQGSQTIVFGPAPTGINVGAKGRVVHATASSNLAVTYGSQTIGICTVDPTTGALALLAVGTCLVSADQAGNANWNAAPQQVLSLAVAPPFTVPTLTVTPDPQTRAFGTPNPTFTYVISGFINNQTLATALVSGAPACTTTATLFSPAGTYPITCSIGTLTSPFYSFTFVPGTLTITHGASSVSLSTTTTVFETSTPVTWTAAVEPGVSGATPTGNLVFTIDGVARPAVPLDANGRGSVTVTWPTTGVKNVSVAYSGDASYAAPGTASATPTVVANTARASGVGLSGTSIYPIVDGWLDTVTARGNRLEPLPVTITVKNAAGAAVPDVQDPDGIRTIQLGVERSELDRIPRVRRCLHDRTDADRPVREPAARRHHLEGHPVAAHGVMVHGDRDRQARPEMLPVHLG